MALNIICYLVLSEMRQRGWVWHKILLTGFPFFPISNAKCHRFVPLELPCQKRTIFTQYIMASLRMWYHFHSPWEWYKNIVTALWDIYKTGTSTWRISQLRNNSVSRIIFFLFFYLSYYLFYLSLLSFSKKVGLFWELLVHNHYKLEDPQRSPSTFLKILGPLHSFSISQPWLPRVMPFYK